MRPPTAATERGNNYQIDGIDNNYTQTINAHRGHQRGCHLRVPRRDVQPTSAEYGRAGGAIIDVVTKAAPANSTARPSTSCAPRTSTPRPWSRTATTCRRRLQRHQYSASAAGDQGQGCSSSSTPKCWITAPAPPRPARCPQCLVGDRQRHQSRHHEILSLCPAPNGGAGIPASAPTTTGRRPTRSTPSSTPPGGLQLQRGPLLLVPLDLQPWRGSGPQLPAHLPGRPALERQAAAVGRRLDLDHGSHRRQLLQGRLLRGNNSWVRENVDADLVFGGYAVDPRPTSLPTPACGATAASIPR